MIILLPPSEGKTPARTGRPLDLETLTFPELTPHRTEGIKALDAVSAGPDALSILGVSASLGADVERNTHLFTMPAAPAIKTYTGVLYSALDASSLDTRGNRRLAQVYVSSALFGIVNAKDRIPAYRLSMKATLPPLGSLAAWWRDRLTPVLDEAFAGQLILDCRSTDYRRSWPGPVNRTVAVDVVTEAAGKRTVVSHNAKHARGKLCGHLLRRAARLPNTLSGLEAAASEAFRIEMTPATAKAPAALTIVT